METVYDRATTAALALCSNPRRFDSNYDAAYKAFEAIADPLVVTSGGTGPDVKDLMHIRPVVRREGDLFFIAKVDPFRTAFTWAPKLEDKAEGLVAVATIKTLHRYAYYGFFKPSVGEVLCQIPEELRSTVVAFETEGPQTADDLNKDLAALDAGFQVAETILYSKG